MQIEGFRRVSIILFMIAPVFAFADGDFAFRECRAATAYPKDKADIICAATTEHDADLAEKDGKKVLIIGEHHKTSPSLMSKARELLDQFQFRALESFPSDPSWFQRLYQWYRESRFPGHFSLIEMAQTEGFTLIQFKDQEFTAYRDGKWEEQALRDFKGDLVLPYEPINFMLERDSTLIGKITGKCRWPDGFDSGDCEDLIVNLRTVAMSESIPLALERFPERREMLVVVGAAHRRELSNLLRCRYGFKITPLVRNLTRGSVQALIEENVRDLCH